MGAVSDLRFAPDGRTLAIAGGRSAEILLWDVQAGRPRMWLRGHERSVRVLAFATDGRSLASACLYVPQVLVWDLEAGQMRSDCPCCRGWSRPRPSPPDSRTLAASIGTREAVCICDARTGAHLRTIGGRDQPARALAFAPDGRILATAGHDGTVGLFNPETGRELVRLDGLAATLSAVAFSPDGRTLLAIGNDDDIRTWDLPARPARMNRRGGRRGDDRPRRRPRHDAAPDPPGAGGAFQPTIADTACPEAADPAGIAAFSALVRLLLLGATTRRSGGPPRG